MITAKRSVQARINGAKSKGPITPEGKARSSMNSLRHGRYANHATVLSNEDKELFDALADAYFRHIGPLDSVETRYARDLASTDWRLDHNRAVEARLHAFLARRISALQSARRKTLSALQQYKKTRSAVENTSQQIHSKPLTQEFDPRSEPDSNPA